MTFHHRRARTPVRTRVGTPHDADGKYAGGRPSVGWLGFESSTCAVPEFIVLRAGAPEHAIYSLWRSADAIAAPTMPASLRSSAGLTGVLSVSRGTHFSESLLTPPPTTNRSGVNSRSTWAM